MLSFSGFISENGLWANIHKKRKEGRPMRKPGSKGAPTKKDFDSARGEGVEENKARQSADLAKAMAAFKKRGGKIKKVAPGKAAGYHGKDDPGKDVKGMMDRPDTKRMPRKKVRSLRAGVEEKKSETWEAGYKRRVVKTTDPEHKKKGYNWRIKGKERPEISIKLYKSKPDQAEFNKQMKRVAGHEFGG